MNLVSEYRMRIIDIEYKTKVSEYWRDSKKFRKIKFQVNCTDWNNYYKKTTQNAKS